MCSTAHGLAAKHAPQLTPQGAGGGRGVRRGGRPCARPRSTWIQIGLQGQPRLQANDPEEEPQPTWERHLGAASRQGETQIANGIVERRGGLLGALSSSDVAFPANYQEVIALDSAYRLLLHLFIGGGGWRPPPHALPIPQPPTSRPA